MRQYYLDTTKKLFVLFRLRRFSIIFRSFLILIILLLLLSFGGLRFGCLCTQVILIFLFIGVSAPCAGASLFLGLFSLLLQLLGQFSLSFPFFPRSSVFLDDGGAAFGRRRRRKTIHATDDDEAGRQSTGQRY